LRGYEFHKLITNDIPSFESLLATSSGTLARSGNAVIYTQSVKPAGTPYLTLRLTPSAPKQVAPPGTLTYAQVVKNDLQH